MRLPSKIELETPYGRAFADPIVIAGHLEARGKSQPGDWILNT